MEKQLVPAAGYRIELIACAPLFGASWAQRALAGRELLRGVAQARRCLRNHQTELLIGFGGYASAGAVLAARSLRVPIVIHDSNALPGLTNRLLGRVADGVALSFAGAQHWFPPQRSRVVGSPVRAAVSELGEARQPPDRARPAHVLILGGSLGSPFLNREAPLLLAKLAAAGLQIKVRHQAGKPSAVPFSQHDRRFAAPDLAAIERAYEERAVAAEVQPYIDDMRAAYAWADVCITCAGSAMAEIAATGLPAVVVPLSAASEDHQSANAAAFAADSGIFWVRETEWNRDSVAQKVAGWLTSPDAWRNAAATMRLAARADAAAQVVALCEAVLHSSCSSRSSW
jgi:UDP-N-acetylglucosamine--N-acetylmuramyl-(pentapeptide) pyrophosphoryl-undecaprenol N-acetylglucosamine transferase